MKEDVMDKIAIIGMNGRFPGAENVEEFWNNIQSGKGSIRTIQDDELLKSGVKSASLTQENYVKRASKIDDIDKFDASFFGFSPREAAIMDPQHRIILQLAWQLIEESGYDPQSLQEKVGVFCGSSRSTYLTDNLLHLLENDESLEQLQLTLGNDPDYLASRISYKLGFTGPSIAIQTACSSSLVAVSTACDSLLNYGCDLAIAGGVTVKVPMKRGYHYHAGGILSQDGCCRPFDEKANGTVFGDGAGLVAMKRLEDAISAGDPIHAIIIGYGVNNDGDRKVGYTAPSVLGQANAIAAALSMAEIDPSTVSYVETHGTGTQLGDPIEVEALTKAYRTRTDKENFCALGSVKANVGHLEYAAGIAGLIKAIKVIQSKSIPKLLHFSEPNPNLNLAESPFYVPREQVSIPSENKVRVGVSAFGIGGTNSHIIIEDAPETYISSRKRRLQNRKSKPCLLLWSAKEANSATMFAKNLNKDLWKYSDLELPDIAYTLINARQKFNHRNFVVCDSISDASSKLGAPESDKSLRNSADFKSKIVFMFPGQGSQYLGMSKSLYDEFPYYREQFDLCAEYVAENSKIDLWEIVFKGTKLANDSEGLLSTEIAQVALFTVEYCIAKLLERFGIKADAMIGHSIGEYVSACLAGVFSLKDAISIVLIRGRLMASTESGKMLAVAKSHIELNQVVTNDVDLAAINSEKQIVLSGSLKSINRLSEVLEQEKTPYQMLSNNKAFHSRLMDSILEEFKQALSSIHLTSPNEPFVSNLSGEWIGSQECTNPEYWVSHLRETVLFDRGIKSLCEKYESCCFIEVGPGETLSKFVRRNTCVDSNKVSILGTIGVDSCSLKSEEDKLSNEFKMFLNLLGVVWSQGKSIDFDLLYSANKCCRVPLTPYAFKKEKHWIESQRNKTGLPSNSEEADIVSKVKEASLDFEQTVERLKSEFGFDVYKDSSSAVDTLCSAILKTTFSKIGISEKEIISADLNALIKQYNLAPLYEKLLNRFREVLVGEIEISSQDESISLKDRFLRLKQRYPSIKIELELLENCSLNLAEILKGQKNPLDILFPKGDLAGAMELYGSTVQAKMMNCATVNIVKLLLSGYSDQKEINVIEIGGGTGGMTNYLLPELSDVVSKYLFTDISLHFIGPLLKKYQKYACLEGQRYDVSLPPGSQSIAEYNYDLVVSANALHAAQNLKTALANVFSMLKPGGMVVLLEGTAPTAWADMTYGLTEGWWHFDDGVTRNEYPLLSTDTWKQLFSDAGFIYSEALSPMSLDGGIFNNQTILIAVKGFESKAVNLPKMSMLESNKPYVAAENRITEELSDTEKLVKNVWEEIFGIKLANKDGNFFDLGGDSLVSVQFFSRIKNDLGVELNILDLNDAPTLRTISERIENAVWMKETVEERDERLENALEGEI